jgi:sugar (pentulose or hexulose) kinase
VPNLKKGFVMSVSRHIAVDMGAGSVRILVGTMSEEHIDYEEIYRFENEIKHIDGADKWDIEEIYKNILHGISMALEKYPEAESIGVDSWGVDYVLLDKDGKLIEIPYAYRDSRTEGMPERWKGRMSEEETFRRTGINFYVFNTLFQLFASRGDKALKEAETLLFIPNYIYYRLTGKRFNETSIASTSQLLSVGGKAFDESILEKLGIEPSLFAPVVPAGKVLGVLTEKKLSGNHVKAVMVCSHDTASAVAAIPVEEEDFLFIATGTWCILGTEAKEPLLSEPARALGFTNERGCNHTFRTLKNIVGLWLVQGIQKAVTGNPSFAELEAMANRAEENDLLVNPEDPLFYNPDDMIRAFDTYFEKTGQSKPATTGQYVACAYKSLSVAFAYYLNKLQRLTGKIYQTVYVFGGGSQSEMLCRFIADHAGRKVVSGPVEAATYGNIMVQAMATGRIKDIKEGRRVLKNSFNPQSYQPSVSDNEREELFKKYLSLKTYKNGKI